MEAAPFHSPSWLGCQPLGKGLESRGRLFKKQHAGSWWSTPGKLLDLPQNPNQEVEREANWQQENSTMDTAFQRSGGPWIRKMSTVSGGGGMMPRGDTSRGVHHLGALSTRLLCKRLVPQALGMSVGIGNMVSSEAEELIPSTPVGQDRISPYAWSWP